LQPSLLDRLTDDNPDVRVESRDQRVIDIRRLREIVQRDLSWLLNTSNNADWIDEDVSPHVARSVVNYGVETVSGEFSTERRAEMIRLSIARAIELFEPRIRRGTTRVEMRTDNVSRQSTVNYDIRSEMWADPVPVELYLRSSVDVTTGEVSLERAG
jgi:type VI secretion system protein ImpF